MKFNSYKHIIQLDMLLSGYFLILYIPYKIVIDLNNKSDLVCKFYMEK